MQHVATGDTTRCIFWLERGPSLHTTRCNARYNAMYAPFEHSIASFSLAAGSPFLSQGRWLPFQPPKIDSQITLICAKCE